MLGFRFQQEMFCKFFKSVSKVCQKCVKNALQIRKKIEKPFENVSRMFRKCWVDLNLFRLSKKADRPYAIHFGDPMRNWKFYLINSIPAKPFKRALRTRNQ